MRYSFKLLCAFLLGASCERDNGMIAGVPIEVDLMGTWNLEKIITPTGSYSGSQIGFKEVLVSGHEVDDEVERVYRNDTLFAKHIWTRVPGTTSKAKDMTVMVTYRGSGLKRFFKIRRKLGEPTTLEASAYLPELGGAADTVKFFYKQVW